MTTMDCRIIDNKVVLRDGSIVSVPAYYFEDLEQTDCYFVKVLKMIDNGKQARVQWIQDNTKSIEDVDNLNLKQNSLQTIKTKLFCVSSLRVATIATSTFKQIARWHLWILQHQVFIVVY